MTMHNELCRALDERRAIIESHKVQRAISRKEHTLAEKVDIQRKQSLELSTINKRIIELQNNIDGGTHA